MKLAISNIAWDECNDKRVYQLLCDYGYVGVEIAPTRIFSDSPYDKLTEAEIWSKKLYDEWGLSIPSMQSIWYGRQEKLFETEEERKILVEYTKKAIDFAQVIGCRNLVFGCPRNRNMPEGMDKSIAIDFFKEVGDYAAAHQTVIGMEANPTIYNTNYINETKQAIELIKEVDSRGFLLNLDIGTMIYNGESVSELVENVSLINHVHVSEPGLKPIEKRSIHKELADILLNEGYKGYVSIEMGKVEDISVIEDSMQYVKSIFDK